MANIKSIARLGSLANLAKKTKELAAEEPATKRFRLLRIDEVVSHDQVRKTFDDLENLAASIKELGVQVPINVLERDREGHYVILQGERRWRAAKLAGLTKIPAIVDEAEIDEQTRMLMQLTENLQRDDMRPLEVAKAFRALVDTGLNAAKIAKSLGRSHQFVSTYLHINDLPDFLRQIAEEGRIKDATTLLLLKRAFDSRPEDAEGIILASLDENGSISRSAAKALAQKMKEPEPVPEEEGPSASSERSANGAAANAEEIPEEAAKAPTVESRAEEPLNTGNAGKTVSDEPARNTLPSAEAEPAPAEAEPAPAEAEPAPAEAVSAEESAAKQRAPQEAIPNGLAGQIRLVPIQSLRVIVDVVTRRDGETDVEEGWLANNAVSNASGLFCVKVLHEGREEMLLAKVEDIELKRVESV